MKKNKSIYILLKSFIGILLVVIVSWPFWVSHGSVIELFSDITRNVNINVTLIIILYLFLLFISGIYLIVNSISEIRDYIRQICVQHNISRRKLFLIKLKWFLSPTVYVGLTESVFIFIIPVHLILADRILLPAVLLYSIYRKFISSQKRWEIPGLFIIIVNHIIIHVKLDIEPWYAKYIFAVLEKLAEFYNLS